MQDFIVWYKNKDTNKVFSREFNLNQLILQNHLDEICDSPGCVDYEILSILPSIGKDDIKGNKIYADSSIVEFEFLAGGNGITVFKWKKFIGWFSFCANALSYRIKTIDGKSATYHINKVRSIKFIDTIQENKLKLI